jgi:hypothetical protein
MPNLRKWMMPEGEQGCRSAAMDPAIKLFGQTIGVISSHTDAGADAGVLKKTSASLWDAAQSCSQVPLRPLLFLFLFPFCNLFIKSEAVVVLGS